MSNTPDRPPGLLNTLLATARLSWGKRKEEQATIEQQRSAAPTPAPSKAPSFLPPTCPKCHARMVLRVGQKLSHLGERFWGCPNYPRCHGFVPLAKG